jgi:hypothetical protein
MNYLRDQSRYRNTTAYILDTTPGEEQCMINYLKGVPPRMPDPKSDPISALTDNCATRTSAALSSCGVRGFSKAWLPTQVGAAAEANGGVPTSLNQGAAIPADLSRFDPR